MSRWSGVAVVGCRNSRENPGWAAGDVITNLTYGPGGRLATQATVNGAGLPAQSWYSFTSPGYNKVDDLTAYTDTRYGPGAITHNLQYTTDGTRRLTRDDRPGPVQTDWWSYDVYGNRVTANYTGSGSKGENTFSCAVSDTLMYGADNRLVKKRRNGCVTSFTYFTDQAGNRLAEVDTANGGPTLPTVAAERYTYTAANQLYFSLTQTGTLGTYDVNWHWYDGSGMRIVSQASQLTAWYPTLDPAYGNRTYYVYDGGDVAMTLVRSAPQGQGVSYEVHQRFMTGGLDDQIAVRMLSTNLALVGDRYGSTVVGVQNNGAASTLAVFWTKDAFGNANQGTGSGSSLNTETGFTGASTPNSTGGFTYLRNRWYDGRTGRFLTQDPIGLAGGVNLYTYAGGNPIAFRDPFGLMDVEYGDDKTRREVDAMRKKSTTFDKAITDLENNHGVLVKIGRGSNASLECGGAGGCAQYNGKNKKGQDVYTATIDEQGIFSDNVVNALVGNPPADGKTTTAHEVYGHIVPWTHDVTNCVDGSPGTPASQSCVVGRENIIRREMGYPPRKQY